MQYLKVKEAEELVRDTSSSAILNTDMDALKAYKLKKSKDNRLEQIAREHEEIKRDMNEIKDLLKELLGRNR
jgi:predicted transcriptional regulator